MQDLEKEIIRLAPNAGKFSNSTLAIAVSNTNSRVRTNGLCAKEVVTKRDNYTNEALEFNDTDSCNQKYLKRLQNHQSSEKSKSRGADLAKDAFVSPGDIVHVKTDGSKHKAREFYLVTSVDRPNREVYIQKFCGSTLREKRYKVKQNEIYLAATNYAPNHNNTDGNEDEAGINLNGEEYDENENEEVPALRRSTRLRKEPDWLATDDIQRREWSSEDE